MDDQLDLTVSGFATNVQQHDALIDAVEAAARAQHPEDFATFDVVMEANLVEKVDKVHDQDDIVPVTTTTTELKTPEVMDDTSAPVAPSVPTAQLPAASSSFSHPSAEVLEIEVVDVEVKVEVVPEVVEVVLPAVVEVVEVVPQVVEAVPKVIKAPIVQVVAPIKNNSSNTSKSVRPGRIKSKPVRVKSSRRDTFSSSSSSITAPVKVPTQVKAGKKSLGGKTRGRTQERVHKNSRRASSGAALSTGTPSYLRPTRSSSLSQERALKRKNNRLSLSESRKKRTGFGGHTYTNKKVRTTPRSLTEPKSFRLSTGGRKRGSDITLSTEAQEVLASQAAQKKVERRRKMNEQNRRRSLAGTNSSSTCSSAAASASSSSSSSSASSSMSTTQHKVTATKEFALSKSTRSRQSLTSEELMMQRVTAEKKEARRLREKNKKTMASSSTFQKHHTARSNKKLTQASSPKLHSRSRPKASLTQRKKEAQVKSGRNNQFSQRLRSRARPTASGSGPVKAVMKQLTRPSTPKFETDRRAKQYKETHNNGAGEETAVSPIVPLAEQVKNLTSKVPDRFHSKPRSHKPPSSSFQPKQLTEPKAPTFATDARAATHPTPKSTDEIEMEQMKQFHDKPFKAKGVDPRVMNSAGDLGVPRLEKKPLTQCESPKFRVDKRASIGRASTASNLNSETHFKPFKAREIGEGVTQGFAASSSYTGPKAPTQFAPFSLSTSKRLTKVQDDEPKYKPFKARPAPISTSAPKLAPQMAHVKELTKPMTPPLASLRRHKEAQKAQAVKVAAQRAAEAQLSSSFRARDIGEGVPAPVYNTSFQPRELTEVTPFNISADSTGQKARREEQLRQEQKEMDKARKFKARPIPKTHDDHHKFELQKSSNRPLTSVQNIVLQSDKRAQDRALYEKHAAERRAQTAKEEENRRIEEEDLRNAVIDAELEAIRFHPTKSTAQVHNFLHKAPTAIKHSEATLVMPQSPRLLTSSRVRSTEQ